MGKRIVWSDKHPEGKKNRARLARMIKAGLSNKEIANIFGTSERNIESVISRFGLQRYRRVPLKATETGANKSKGKRASARSLPVDMRKLVSDPDDDIGTRVKMLVEYDNQPQVGEFGTLSDDDIIRYRNNPIQFMEECIKWNGKELTLFPYQKRWINDKSVLRIAVKSTRIGFSFVNCLEAFWRCLFYPYSTILFVSINQERAKDLLDYIYLFADSNPDLFADIFMRRNEQYCEFTSGSRIFSLPNSPAGVRGIPEVNGIWVYWDEVANFRDGDDDIMYEALQRNLALGGRLSMWSTPFGKRGLFYRIAAPLQLLHHGLIKRLKNDFEFKDFSYHEIPATECPLFDKKRIEMIRRNTDPVTFRQEYLCLTEDNEVITADGIKRISEVKPGMEVLTHSGEFKRVTAVMKRPHRGKVVRFITQYSFVFPTTVTPEHLMLSITKGHQYGKPKWREAHKLDIGDFLAFPIQWRIKDKKVIRISELVRVPKSFRSKWKIHKVDRIPVNEDFLKICGYYVAEGSIGARGKAVSFSFNKSERKHIEDLKMRLKRLFNIEVREHETPTATVVYVNSVILAKLFKRLFGTGASQKRLPMWMLQLPPRKIEWLLSALMNGDGCHRDDFDSYATTSKELALQVRYLFLRLGRIASITKTRKGGYGSIQGRKVYQKEAYQVVWRHSASFQRGFIKDGFLFVPIRKIEIENYDGDVYDLTVEDDHSFVTVSHIVHNCEFVSRGEELFPLEVIQNACVSTPQTVRESSNPYYIGIDFAGEGADRTAIVVVERHEKSFSVRFMKQYKAKGSEFILPIVAGLMQKFTPNRIFTDATGMGSPITRELQREFGTRVEGVVFTNQIKDKLIMNIWALLNDGQLKLLPAKTSEARELITQLNRLEVKRTPTGYTKYEHPKGYHDDLVWALALACNPDVGYWSGYISAFDDNSEIDDMLGVDDEDEDDLEAEIPLSIG